MVEAGGGIDTFADYADGIDKIDVTSLALSFRDIGQSTIGVDKVLVFGTIGTTIMLSGQSAATIDPYERSMRTN